MPAPRSFELELLEPRVLLSATAVPVAASSGGGTGNSAVVQNVVDQPQATVTESSNAQASTIDAFAGVAQTDLTPAQPGAQVETQQSTAQAANQTAVTASASGILPVAFAS